MLLHAVSRPNLLTQLSRLAFYQDLIKLHCSGIMSHQNKAWAEGKIKKS
jgi:hypothetical protein